jgi:hypothetical protein
MGTAWKDLERTVAAHFNTSRRTRGDNFGRSDVEVKATLKEWLGEPWTNELGIVVECKYRQKHEIIKHLEKHDPGIGISIGVIGEYILCWLEDFEEVFNFVVCSEYVSEHRRTPLQVVNDFSIVHISKKAPDYLDKYLTQSREYVNQNKEGVYLPIACLAKARSHKRLVAMSMNDVLKFVSSWQGNLKQKTL